MFKYILILFIFISSIAHAQIVSIPDANFKSALIADGVDTNMDGEIQESEALVTTIIDVSEENIFDMTGLASFTNLIELKCGLNNLTVLDVSQNLLLEVLWCFNNQITTLDVTMLSSLTSLTCFNNQLTNLDLTQNTNLDRLDASSNSLTSLDLSQNIALEQLYIYNNLLNTIDVSLNTNLTNIQIQNNSLTTIDISQNTNLRLLQTSFNQLTTIDLTQNVNLESFTCRSMNITDLDLSLNINLKNLTCDGNVLSQLDLSNNPLLESLDCSMNNLTSLDVSQNFLVEEINCNMNNIPQLDLTGKGQLITLECQDNNLTSLDLSDCDSLEVLDCGVVNLLTTLDLSQNRNLTGLDCSGNGLLTELIIKNGSIESSLSFGGTSLDFICADDDQVLAVQALAELTTVVSSYCTFVPGGDYNTITGSVLFDLNTDGCDAIDIPQPHIKIDLNDGAETGSSFTNPNGDYTFYTEAGNFDITPNLENPTWFNVSPLTVNVPLADTNNNTVIQDFCLTANGIHNDVEIAIAPIDFARPGFDAVYQIVYNNKGNQTISGDFVMTYDGTVLDFVSATTTPSSQVSGSLSWSYVDLLPFENRSVYVTLNVNSPTETPAVNIGDQLNFNVLINPLPEDEFQEDNTFDYKQIVVGSYDPNDIVCIEGDILPTTEIGKFLHYIVNFENIGTFAAQNVVIEMDIDPTQFDVNSLRVLNASHPVSARVKEDKVKFIFEDINLSASGGHGNILLRIKTKDDVQPSETVTKKANIHFDYNFPIETNDANTVFQNLSVDENEIDNSLRIYPNPVKDVLSISATTVINSIAIYDVQGRLIQMRLIKDTHATIDMSNLTNGIYFFKIKTEVGANVEKIIKD